MTSDTSIPRTSTGHAQPSLRRPSALRLLALAAGGLAVAAPVDPWWSAGTAPAVVTVLLAGFIGFLAWQVIAVLPSTTPAAVRSTGRA